MLSELQAQIERITYFNDETGYTVAKVKVYNKKDLVTVVGNMHEMNPGEIIRLKGEWSNHPKFGEQFKVVFYETKTPASVHGIEKYLGSGLIKGIGPVMAKRIVKIFGESTLDVIEEDIKRLVEVEGIGDKRIGMISKAWEEQREIRQVMLFLQSHGISSTYASKIFRHYRNQAINIVKENPYRLATDIFGIGFLTADKIAEKLGFAKDSDLRAQAGILYVLHQLSDEGHVYYPFEMLIEASEKILEVDRQIIINALHTIVFEQRIVIEELEHPPKNTIDNKAVYLSKFHFAESNIASRLKAIYKFEKNIRNINVDKAVDWVEKKNAIQYADKQKEAIETAISSKMMILTGGPGTGKTTIIQGILQIYSAMNIKILLTAPTGRAAKRMSETTGYEAKTIHRMLEYNLQKGGFQCDEDNPLDCDLLIVDESSMIDTILMHHLLKAIPLNATVIFVGDINQLPSVGPGNVLRDMIHSQLIPVVELNTIFRQAKESSIIINAHRINQGRIPIQDRTKNDLDDFYFIEQEDPEKIVETIIKLVKERIPQKFNFDPIDDIQVLTPMQKGTVGGVNLNTQLQNALITSNKSLTRGGRQYSVGDKVMQIKNNYDKEIYNGDIGRIKKIDLEMQEVVIRFEEREIVYEFSELDEIVLAYAVSVHKSQGSEYPAVVIPLTTQHYVMLQRNLFYTAVTRGKKLVVLIGTRKALAIAVKNNKTQKRYSYLKERMVSVWG